MIKYKGKVYNIRFTNLIDFKLSLEGLRYSDLYTLPCTLEQRQKFAKAWCCVLDVWDSEDDLIRNLSPLSEFDDEDLEALAFFEEAQELVEKTWERDCSLMGLVFASDGERESQDRQLSFLEYKEYVCQNCKMTRFEFDNATPKETAVACKVFKTSSFSKILDVHFARLAYCQVASSKVKLEDFSMLRMGADPANYKRYLELKALENKRYREYKLKQQKGDK